MERNLSIFSAFTGKPLRVDKVGIVCAGDSGVASRKNPRSTVPLPPDKSRLILGNGSTKKLKFREKIDLIFRKTNPSKYPKHISGRF